MSSFSFFKSWREAILAKLPEKAPETEDRDSACKQDHDGAVFLINFAGKLTLLHHLTKLERKDKTTSCVALAGISSKATALELKDLETDCQETVDVKCPSWSLFLISAGIKAKSGENHPEKCSYAIPKMVPLPPSLQSTLLNSADQSPATLLPLALRALKEAKVGKDGDKVDGSYKNVIIFLWASAQTANRKLMQVEAKASSCPDVRQWSSKLHHNNIVATKLTPAAQKAKKQRTWDESYDVLLMYKNDFGDCNVPREWKLDSALGEWVKNQRGTQKTLSKEQRVKLESIGFTFSNTQQVRSNKLWDSYYEKLQEYVKVHGNCKPPSQQTKGERSLPHWMSIQRQNHKRGLLSEDHKARLDKLGFVWTYKATYKPRAVKDDKHWERGYDKLVEFHKVNSHINVPKRAEGSRPLWEFLYKQRKAYNEKRLSNEKVQLLEKLGIKWERDNGQELRNSQWHSKYAEAKAFRELHGHLEVPRCGKLGNANLVKWLLRQRTIFLNEKLPADRIKLLRDLDFDFEGKPGTREKQLFDLAWKENYNELLEYHKENGSVNIPETASAKLKRLDKWVSKQKLAATFDLDPDRKALLLDLGVKFVDIRLEAAKMRPKAPGKKQSSSNGTISAIATGTDKENSDRKDETANSEKQPLLEKHVGATDKESGTTTKIGRKRPAVVTNQPPPGKKGKNEKDNTLQ